jgi:hypothetical protein
MRLVEEKLFVFVKIPKTAQKNDSFVRIDCIHKMYVILQCPEYRNAIVLRFEFMEGAEALVRTIHDRPDDRFILGIVFRECLTDDDVRNKRTQKREMIIAIDANNLCFFALMRNFDLHKNLA